MESKNTNTMRAALKSLAVGATSALGMMCSSAGYAAESADWLALAQRYELTAQEHCGGRLRGYETIAPALELEPESPEFLSQYQKCVDHLSPLLHTMVKQAPEIVARECEHLGVRSQWFTPSIIASLSEQLANSATLHKTLFTTLKQLPNEEELSTIEEVQEFFKYKMAYKELMGVTVMIDEIYLQEDCGYAEPELI